MSTGDSSTITIRLLLFAQFREAFGARERSLQVPPGQTPRQVLAEVSTGRPRLLALGSVVRFIVNDEFTSGDHPLRDGDELAFVPPVAGG